MTSTRYGRWWVAGLVVLPLLVKLHLLLGLYQASPIYLYSGLTPGPVMGRDAYPTIDFNDGAISEALGRRAAFDLVHGVLPWWNSYEGVGTPLAGEMQSAALLPLTPLLLLPKGQLLFHLVLQMIAGVAAFGLMRRLGVAELAAFGTGMLFAFNGTYAWLANAVVNPIAFLPVILLGIENVRAGRRGGWRWIAGGVALSLYAGFPEVAYIDGLLAGVWALARLPGLAPAAVWGFGVRLVTGVVVGLLLAAPVLIAFADYLPHATLVLHQNGFLSSVHISTAYALNLLLPYGLGQISQTPNLGTIVWFWGLVGGYFGIGLVMLAGLGLAGPRLRGLRLALAGWVVLCLVLAYAPGLGWLLRLVPGLGNAAFYRYYDPAAAMALAVLAGLALDDVIAAGAPAAGQRYWLALTGTALLLVLGLGLGLLGARHVLAGSVGTRWFGISLGVAAAMLVGLAGIGRLAATAAGRAAALALLVGAEAVFNFAVPTFNYPRHPHLALGGVAFLRAHLGLQRIYSLGVIQPNYGSYFGIAEIDDCDLPIPADWLEFRRGRLDPNSNILMFDGRARQTGPTPTVAAMLTQNLGQYEAVGVKYVVARTGEDPLAREAARPVYEDGTMTIHELPAPRPYFDAAGCVVAGSGRLEAVLDCQAPTTLTRLELWMPGWRAEVNGAAEVVRRDGPLFQAVTVPAGHSTVRFWFRPPFMLGGYLAFWVGVLCLVVRRREVRRCHLNRVSLDPH